MHYELTDASFGLCFFVTLLHATPCSAFLARIIYNLKDSWNNALFSNVLPTRNCDMNEANSKDGINAQLNVC